MNQCAKLHVAGWTWAVFTLVNSKSCISLSPQFGNFWIPPGIGRRYWGECSEGMSGHRDWEGGSYSNVEKIT
jgi:hypothetical protein